MDAKKTLLTVLIALSPLVAARAQESADQYMRNELEALKTELKSTQERLDKLAQQVSDLRSSMKDKGAAETTPPRAAPVETPAPAAAAEKPAPAEVGNVRTHTVAKGETLTQIAKQYAVTVQDIEQLNKIGDAKKLQAGQTIKIPPAGGAASPSPSAAK
jgi:LysM repeat protein